jgi:hypothetical protein
MDGVPGCLCNQGQVRSNHVSEEGDDWLDNM